MVFATLNANLVIWLVDALSVFLMISSYHSVKLLKKETFNSFPSTQLRV